MNQPRLVRIYQPADQLEVAQVRMALEGSGIPFFIHNEHFTAAYGLPYSMGAIQVFVMVPEDRAEKAKEVLRDWFQGEGPESSDAAETLEPAEEGGGGEGAGGEDDGEAT